MRQGLLVELQSNHNPLKYVVDFHHCLKRALEEGIRYSELARAFETNVGTVSAWARGKEDATPEIRASTFERLSTIPGIGDTPVLSRDALFRSLETGTMTNREHA